MTQCIHVNAQKLNYLIALSLNYMFYDYIVFTNVHTQLHDDEPARETVVSKNATNKFIIISRETLYNHALVLCYIIVSSSSS